MLKLVTAVWIGLLAAAPALALRPVGTPIALESGSGRDAALQGGLLYATSSAGLQIFDVRDPAAGYPLVSATAGSFRAIELAGPLAYLVGAAGLSVLDLSDPALPAPLGALAMTGTPIDVAVAGARAYVLVQPLALHIADVSDPAAPVLLGGLELEATALLHPRALPRLCASRTASPICSPIADSRSWT